MPVNYSTPSPESLHAVAGVRLGTAEAGIRKANRRDLTLITLDEGAAVAGVFTQNSFCAAPVVLCRQRLAARKPVRALLVNTGNANAGTGEDGLNAARKSCVALGELLGIEAEAVLPFSTGVILEPLPVDRLIAGLPQAIADLKPDNWHAAAQAIMTTDTIAKAASRRVSASGKELTVTGMAKGAGMIRPNMATMLGFIATDACVAPAVLDRLVAEAADRSFNSITVDGDTSTNDSFMLIASGRGKIRIDSESDPDYAVLSDTVCAVALELAQAIVRDAEGATKFITVTVEDGRDRHECRQVAYAIAHSPLVKTAFFASDPNLGRILAAIGYAGVENLDVDAVEVWLGDNQEEIKVAERGGRALTYREEDGARVMKSAEIGVRVRLARGTARAAVYTCDLSYDYVKINADYRS